ncbi:Possible glycosyltransferase [hydrothermal vent metagenome]|uniref:Possible glycosyltransferase n=1 Tax=hydrothermal vent metagenome TaxID=652676 RepID=A0A1W1C1J0_9ZZZZ
MPFLGLLPRLMEYEFICKLHSKKSVEIESGDAWRKLLYYDLIGSDSIVKKNIKRFEDDKNLGMITGKNLILNGVHFNLDNQKNLQNLASQAKISFSPEYSFPAGTMFWLRLEIFAPLLPLIENNTLKFEEELGQTDHTLAHALERFFGLLCKSQNKSIEESHADYQKLNTNILNDLAKLAFTQRFQNDREIQYRDKLIQERDAEIQKIDAEIIAIHTSKSYKASFIFRKLPFIFNTIIHFNIKKLNMPDSNEFRIKEAVKRRMPTRLLNLLKKVKRKLKKQSQKDKLWHQDLKNTSYQGKSILIVAELSIAQCTKYRVEQKVEMIEHLGYRAKVVSWTDFHEARHLLQTSALVIFYRVPADTVVLDLIKEAKRLNITSFFDVDDVVFDRKLLSENINIQALDKKTQKLLLNGADLYQEALSLTDHSTSSTPTLASLMQKHNDGEHFIIPNCLDKELLSYLDSDISKDVEKIKIVYGSGTSTHDIDFLEVSDALLFILQKYPHVKLIIHGTLTLPSIFETELLKPQITQIPFMPTAEYYKALQSYDINLAPLEGSLFNDAKSNIKYLEASILKLPTIASDVAEYRSSISKGINGFIAKDTASWIDALEQLIENKTLREEIAQNAHSVVIKEYSIEDIAVKNMKPLLDKYMTPKAQNTKQLLMVNVLYNPISFGGATIVIEELSQRITKKDGYEVTVFTGFFDENYDLPRPYDLLRYEVNGISVILLRFPFPMSQTQDYRNEHIEKVFEEMLLSLEPDLVHFHSIQQLSASIVKPCLSHKIPYIITLHDMWWLCEKQFMINAQKQYCYQSKIDTNYCITQCTANKEATQERTKYLRPLLRQANLLLAPSTFQAQMYSYNLPKTQNIKVNKNAIIFPSSAYVKTQNNKIRFAYLGGKATHKGYDMMKEVFENLDSDAYELVIVDLHLKLGHHSIDESDWDIHGSLELSKGYNYSQKGLDDFFASIDVLLFPSQWKESFGLTIREALVRDVWVISTDAGGVVEDIREGENGNILSIGDDEGYKQAIEKSIKEFSTQENYTNPYKNEIRAYDAQVEELLGYYDELWRNS